MEKIKIEYNGAYPNLCSGQLVVFIGVQRWDFPQYCMSSGGSVWFDDNCDEHIEDGDWNITEWPINFPEELKSDVLSAVNESVEQGCCGGCRGGCI